MSCPKVELDPGDDDPSHYFGDEKAAIDVELLVDGDEADAPTGPTVQAGSSINWTYRVTNTGAVALNSIKATDSKSSAVSCPKTGLRPGIWAMATRSGTAPGVPHDQSGAPPVDSGQSYDSTVP